MAFEKSLDPAVALPQICQHLRSKHMYVTGSREPSDESYTAGHCWCNLTQDVRGPDALLVDRKACDAARSCYQSLV